jgi:hypothetical protein
MMATANLANSRIAALRERERRLKELIAEQLLNEEKRKNRQKEQLVKIVGAALIDEAARSPNFKTMLRQTLSSSVVDEKSRRVLSKMGWL